jgi:hypothetical protein
MSDSTIYTIGTALNRARDSDTPVQVLVDGHWLSGRVVAVDGHGLVLESDDLDHAVVRIERVTAVRIFSAVPDRTPITAGAHPMPSGPNISYE